MHHRLDRSRHRQDGGVSDDRLVVLAAELVLRT